MLFPVPSLFKIFIISSDSSLPLHHIFFSSFLYSFFEKKKVFLNILTTLLFTFQSMSRGKRLENGTFIQLIISRVKMFHSFLWWVDTVTRIKNRFGFLVNPAKKYLYTATNLSLIDQVVYIIHSREFFLAIKSSACRSLLTTKSKRTSMSWSLRSKLRQ